MKNSIRTFVIGSIGIFLAACDANTGAPPPTSLDRRVMEGFVRMFEPSCMEGIQQKSAAEQKAFAQALRANNMTPASFCRCTGQKLFGFMSSQELNQFVLDSAKYKEELDQHEPYKTRMVTIVTQCLVGVWSDRTAQAEESKHYVVVPTKLSDIAEVHPATKHDFVADRIDNFNRARNLAEQGDANAQYSLGYMYRTGQGASYSLREAVKWYRKAALQGELRAMDGIALLHEKGLGGLKKNDPEAVKWYRKAAEKGYAPSQRTLAYKHSIGDSVPKNRDDASIWFRKAAEQGYVPAQIDFARFYRWRWSGNRNDFSALFSAHFWLNLAVTLGSRDAKRYQYIGIFNIDDIIRHATDLRDRLTKNMTPEQVAMSERLGQDWIVEFDRLKNLQAAAG